MTNDPSKTKQCPQCAETILAAAIKCKHCGSSLRLPVAQGDIYEGVVTGVREFGCFVEVVPGRDGLVHISELCEPLHSGPPSHVPSEFVVVGQKMRVKVIEIDAQGRIHLSQYAAQNPSGKPRREEGPVQDKRCFIATACCGSSSPVLPTLWWFRDEYLRRTEIGRLLIGQYYKISPLVACKIERYPAVRRIVRIVMLQPIVRVLCFLRKARHADTVR